jgi:colicin import membrane protein
VSIALQRNDLTAGLLAAAVHGFFVLLLVFGVSWQIHDPQPIMADLWQSLPELPPPPPPPEPEPLPAPEAKPLPVPETKAADIALEKEKQEEKRLKQKQALELEKRKKEAQLKKEEDRRRELELAREAEQMEALKREQEKKLADQKRRDVLRREEEEMLKRSLDESIAADASQLKAKAAAEQQRALELAKIVARYKDMISAKVRGNTRLPENLTGNPEAEFAVDVLPTGEISKVRLIKGSGNAAYDQAVQRAIEKSSPFQLPPDKSAAAEFRNLVLKHKARE